MNAFENFDEGGFLTLKPAQAAGKRKSQLRIAFMRLRSAERLVISVSKSLLAEIGGPRLDVAWNPVKRLILVKSAGSGAFEASSPDHHVSARILVPIPGGLNYHEQGLEPEFYVDRIGKRILIEVPVEFGRRPSAPFAAAPAPTPPAAPAIASSEIESGNGELQAALGIVEGFPREFGGQRFTPSEAAMLQALYRRAEVSREGLLSATHKPERGDDDRDINVVAVMMSNMRKRLSDAGIVVAHLGGGRYRMDAGGKGVIRAAIVAQGGVA